MWFVIDHVYRSHEDDHVIRSFTSSICVSLKGGEGDRHLVPEPQRGDDGVQDGLPPGGGHDQLPHGGGEAEDGGEVQLFGVSSEGEV